MVKVNMSFGVDGEQQLSRFFEHASGELPDFTETFKAWGEEFRQTQHSVFVNEGAFEGRSRWQELSPKYKEWKEFHYSGTSILRLTGRLWNSLVSEQHSDHIFEADEEEMKIGTAVPYATFHQHGKGVPQRKVIELTQPQKTRWVRICRSETWGQLEGMTSSYDFIQRG